MRVQYGSDKVRARALNKSARCQNESLRRTRFRLSVLYFFSGSDSPPIGPRSGPLKCHEVCLLRIFLKKSAPKVHSYFNTRSGPLKCLEVRLLQIFLKKSVLKVHSYFNSKVNSGVTDRTSSNSALLDSEPLRWTQGQ